MSRDLFSKTTDLFDNFEVQFVAEFSESGETFCEVIDETDEAAKEEANRTFWTVYGHLPEGGVEALIDVNTKEHAYRLCNFFNELLARGKRNG